MKNRTRKKLIAKALFLAADAILTCPPNSDRLIRRLHVIYARLRLKGAQPQPFDLFICDAGHAAFSVRRASAA